MRISAEYYPLRPTSTQKNRLLIIQPEFMLFAQRSLDIKNKILKLLNSWPGWKSRDDYYEMVADIKKVTTIPELISIVGTYNP